VDITAYLDRINYYGPLAPTAETLWELQVAHLLTVPFENLSIHARQPIVLDDNALFEKIVRRRRGGFCYEANGLFAALLRALGFDVTMLSAGVANPEEGYEYSDYEGMCLYHQTSPQSHFTRGRICSRATPDGRVTLSEMRLIKTGNGERQERALKNEEEYAATLREYFGIALID